jgi:hypothetical protein
LSREAGAPPGHRRLLIGAFLVSEALGCQGFVGSARASQTAFYTPHLIMEFLEDLNIAGITCPPKEASPQELVVYRLVDNMPITIKDIWSYRALYPVKVFKADECKARACSVFTDCKEAENLRKLPQFREKKVIVINIEKKDGVLLNTPSKAARSHHSWWIAKEFDISSDNIKEAV